MNPDFVTVVSGLPRSGTSLVMQMLAAGGMSLLTDQFRAADESNPDGYFEYEPVKRLARDASWFPAAAGRAVKIAIPLLTFLPPAPPSRILLLERDLREIAASQIAMLQRLGKPVRFTAAELIQELEKLLAVTEHFLSSRQESPVLRLSFHSLLTSPSGSAAAIAAFLELSLDLPAMTACARPALYREKA